MRLARNSEAPALTSSEAANALPPAAMSTNNASAARVNASSSSVTVRYFSRSRDDGGHFAAANLDDAYSTRAFTTPYTSTRFPSVVDRAFEDSSVPASVPAVPSEPSPPSPRSTRSAPFARDARERAGSSGGPSSNGSGPTAANPGEPLVASRGPAKSSRCDASFFFPSALPVSNAAPRNAERACASRTRRRYRNTRVSSAAHALTPPQGSRPQLDHGARQSLVVNAAPEPVPPRTRAGNHSSSSPPSGSGSPPSAPAPRASVRVTLARSLGVLPNSAHARRSAPPGPHAASTATPAGWPGTRIASLAATLIARLAPSVSSAASSAAATPKSSPSLPGDIAQAPAVVSATKCAPHLARLELPTLSSPAVNARRRDSHAARAASARRPPETSQVRSYATDKSDARTTITLTPRSAPNGPTPRVDVSHAPLDFLGLCSIFFENETPLDASPSSPAEVSIGDVPGLGVDGEEAAAASSGKASASATTSAYATVGMDAPGLAKSAPPYPGLPLGDGALGDVCSRGSRSAGARRNSACPRDTRRAPPLCALYPPPSAASCTSAMRASALLVEKTASSSPTVNPASAMAYVRSGGRRTFFFRRAPSSLLTSYKTLFLRVCTVSPSAAARRNKSPTTSAWYSSSRSTGSTSTARRQPSRPLASVGSALGDQEISRTSRPTRVSFRGDVTLTLDTSVSRDGLLPVWRLLEDLPVSPLAAPAPPAAATPAPEKRTTYASATGRSFGTTQRTRTEPSFLARVLSIWRHHRPLQLLASAMETVTASCGANSSALKTHTEPCSSTSPDRGDTTRIAAPSRSHRWAGAFRD